MKYFTPTDSICIDSYWVWVYSKEANYGNGLLNLETKKSNVRVEIQIHYIFKNCLIEHLFISFLWVCDSLSTSVLKVPGAKVTVIQLFLNQVQLQISLTIIYMSSDT